jgi:hypothetical protein
VMKLALSGDHRVTDGAQGRTPPDQATAGGAGAPCSGRLAFARRSPSRCRSRKVRDLSVPIAVMRSHHDDGRPYLPRRVSLASMTRGRITK